ncbi:MAG: hypothetical protein IJW38_03990 [Clostridia bacterium]|nr:hypothetical protein [Clostridia bacterium]
MERYGDYNEYEEDLPKSKNPILLIIKILIAIVCLAVIGVLVFRISFFNYYPDSMENLYFDEVLTEYYNANSGNLEVKTQEIRAKYDNPEVATFICDNLYVIDGASQLQLSIRYNESAIEYIENQLSLSGLDASDPELFSYKLVTYDDELKSEIQLDAAVKPAVYETKLMYHYYKLICNGVELGGLNDPGWIRLDVFVKGAEKKFASIYIYENNDSYSIFENYELKSEDTPK